MNKSPIQSGRQVLKYLCIFQYQLHSLERASGSIGLHVNADKTEYMCFSQRGDISTLNGNCLKQVNKFT